MDQVAEPISSPPPTLIQPAADAGPPPDAKAEQSPYNLKLHHPSATMLPPDGHRYTCTWLENSITVHSDGNVSCGLDDPHGRRSFGNLTHQSAAEVFANPEFLRLRDKLWAGYRCSDCSLYRRHTLDAEERPERPALPSTMVVETTVRCNLRCPQAACDPNNDRTLRTRDRDELPLDGFRGIVDQLRNTLKDVYFFNYGEPFFHRNAVDMLAYLHEACPTARIITSTNAIPLATRGKAERVVPCLDQITVTLGGITQPSYARYHVGGQVGQALLGLQNICAAKRALGLATPQVTWRYLLFKWTDSEAEVEAALALARLYGVDEFQLYLTHIPEGGASYRFLPGTRLFAKYRRYIDAAYGFPCRTAPEDGLYPVELIREPDLGPVRWTSWRARLRRRRHGHWLRLSVSTTRPPRAAGLGHCFVRTPWATHKVELRFGVWQDFSFLVPWEARHEDEFDLAVVTFDDWFPVDELGSEDTRCLGVLVKEGDGDGYSRSDHDRHLDLLRLPPPTAGDLALLDELQSEAPGIVEHSNGGRFPPAPGS